MEKGKTVQFVRVPNDWYQLDDLGSTFAARLGGNAFTMWFSINKVSAQMNMSQLVQLQIKQVVSEMKGIKGFAKAENVRKILLDLKKHKLIECKQLTSKTKPTDLINVQLIEPDYSKGFSAISCQLYEDKIQKIQPNGLLVYCLLYKNHNCNLGDQVSGFGLCQMTREAICRFTGINSVKTVSKVISDLKKAKGLISVTQHRYEREVNGRFQNDWYPNTFEVYAKYDSSNKYFIEFDSKKSVTVDNTHFSGGVNLVENQAIS